MKVRVMRETKVRVMRNIVMLDYCSIMANIIVGKFLIQVVVMVNEVRWVVVSSFYINVV